MQKGAVRDLRDRWMLEADALFDRADKAVPEVDGDQVARWQGKAEALVRCAVALGNANRDPDE